MRKPQTILLEENLLQVLQQLARRRNISLDDVIQEALAQFVAAHQEARPLSTIICLGESNEVTDVADGEDEEMLRQGVHPIYGWSKSTNDKNIR